MFVTHLRDSSEERINDALIELVTACGDGAPKTPAAHVGWIRCFLSAVPNADDAVVFNIGEELLGQLRVLKIVFEPALFDSRLEDRKSTR